VVASRATFHFRPQRRDPQHKYHKLASWQFSPKSLPSGTGAGRTTPSSTFSGLRTAAPSNRGVAETHAFPEPSDARTPTILNNPLTRTLNPLISLTPNPVPSWDISSHPSGTGAGRTTPSSTFSGFLTAAPRPPRVGA
jgi:hypothetical protein